MPLPWLLERARPRIAWPSLDGFPLKRRISWVWLRQLPALLCGLAIGALAVALARPQTVGGVTRIAGQGVAIVVALDQSSSMNAVDFPTDRGTRKISRLEAAKTTFTQFVEGGSDDLIGLVVFANYPELACPPILDHAFLIESVANVRSARAGGRRHQHRRRDRRGSRCLAGRTAQEEGARSLDRRQQRAGRSPAARSRGGGYAGPRPGRDPAHDRDRASRAALRAASIRSRERPPQGEVEGPNVPLLEKLAELTGGRSFVATDADALTEVFRTIDALEKSPVRGQILTRYDEHYAVYAGLALALLLVERFLRQGKLGRLP